MIKDEAPHFMIPDEDCMGNPTCGYWRQFLTCSDGHIVVGCDDTKIKAEERASRSREAHEDYLKLPVEIRLKKFAEGDLCDRDMKEAIRLLIKLAIQGHAIIGRG